MGQYTLKIDTFTLLVTPEYSPQIDYLWKEDGSQVAAREKWPLRCWLVADNPSLRSQWNAFLALVETGHPKDVRFLLDGAPVDDLLVSRHNNSPRFENIHTVMAGGAFVNHVEFTMDVVADRAVKFDGIIDVDEVEDVTSGPEGVRRNVRIKAVGKPLAGKTGTSNDSNDTWFVGFAPDLAVGVFVGFDTPRTLGKETGGSTAAPIFRDFMAEALKDKPAIPFRTPPGVRLVRVNRATGLPARAGEGEVITEAFRPGTVPAKPGPVLDAGEAAVTGPSPGTGTGGLY